MKIRIVKASKPLYWYADRIGEIFEVKEISPYYGYWVYHEGTADEYNVDYGDCEIIDEGGGNMKRIDEMITQVGEMIHKAYEEGYAQGRADEKDKIYGPIREIAKKMAEDAARFTPKEYPGQGNYVYVAQSHRDLIVEQAKKDVIPKLGIFFIENKIGFRPFECKAEYIVNKQKRTVVALLKGVQTGIVRAKGIAKCAPDDCFNVHIGKAIALRRALGLEVPAEYLKAPQPTEVRVGDVARYPNGRVVEILKRDNDGNRVKTVETGEISSATSFELVKIIDDSRESEAK